MREPERPFLNHHMDSTRWEHVELAAGDLVINTCYKSGTTLASHIGLLLLKGCDISIGENPAELPLGSHVPWPEFIVQPVEAMKRQVESLPHPRVFKSHLPAFALPWNDSARYLVVARDPADVFVSLYDHFNAFTPEAKVLFGFNESLPPLQIAWKSWIQDGSPFWNYWEHLSSWWTLRGKRNVLLLRYEDLVSSKVASIRKLASWLNVPLDDRIMGQVVRKSSFEHMKKYGPHFAPPEEVLDGKRFINKGVIGRGKSNLEGLSRLWIEPASRFLDASAIGWLQGRVEDPRSVP